MVRRSFLPSSMQGSPPLHRAGAAYLVAVCLCAVGWVFMFKDAHHQQVAHEIFATLCTTAAGFAGTDLRDWAAALKPLWLHWFTMNLAMALPVAIVLVRGRLVHSRLQPGPGLSGGKQLTMAYLAAFVVLCAASAMLGALVQMSVPAISANFADNLLLPPDGQNVAIVAQSGIWILVACMVLGLRLVYFQRPHIQRTFMAQTSYAPANSCPCRQPHETGSNRLQWQSGGKDAVKCCLDCFIWMALLLALGMMQPHWMLLLTVFSVAICIYRQNIVKEALNKPSHRAIAAA
jgi:hypothetical protein